MDDVLDHAHRLLEREPTRCLDALTLYRCTRAGTGSTVTAERFVQRLTDCADRFVVIAPDADEGTGTLTASVVALAAAPLDPRTDHVLHDAHAALAAILDDAALDSDLRRAAESAVHELRAVGAAL